MAVKYVMFRIFILILLLAFHGDLFAATSTITLNSTNPVSGIAIVTSTDVTNAAVTADPANITALTNSDVEFTAMASGNLLSYYWITNSTLAVNGSTLSGATTTSLILSNVVIGQSNMPVAFIVSNYCGSVTSAVATLTVTNSPGGGGVGSTNLLTSLVAYWKMDEQITSGTRADSHTNAFSLSDNNSNIKSNFNAVINYSAQLVGTAGSCLRHADDAGLKLGADTSFTLSLWIITADTFPFPAVLVDKGSAFDLVHDEFLIYYIASGQVRFAVGNGTTSTNIDAATTLSTFTTNHIVGCYSAAEQKLHLYINGTEDGASPVTWTNGTAGTVGPFSLGEASSTTGFATTGNLDEVGYWHRALTSSEVTSLYNSGAGLAFSNFGSTP